MGQQISRSELAGVMDWPRRVLASIEAGELSCSEWWTSRSIHGGGYLTVAGGCP